MITDLSVSVLHDGVWKDIAHVEDNIFRQIIIDLEPLETTQLKVTILKAYHYDRAIVPEIRIY